MPLNCTERPCTHAREPIAMQWSPPRVSVKWPSSADLNAVLCKRSFETPTACRAEHSQVGVARWPAGTATTTRTCVGMPRHSLAARVAQRWTYDVDIACASKTRNGQHPRACERHSGLRTSVPHSPSQARNFLHQPGVPKGTRRSLCPVQALPVLHGGANNGHCVRVCEPGPVCAVVRRNFCGRHGAGASITARRTGFAFPTAANRPRRALTPQP